MLLDELKLSKCCSAIWKYQQWPLVLVSSLGRIEYEMKLLSVVLNVLFTVHYPVYQCSETNVMHFYSVY
jgi:hypothetical protein